MKVCKEAHDEIAFASALCPACMIIAYFTEKVTELNERIEVLEGEFEETKELNEMTTMEKSNG